MRPADGDRPALGSSGAVLHCSRTPSTALQGTAALQEIHISARSIGLFEPLLGCERLRALERQAAAIREALGGCSVWNISSTAAGGGVAEMLQSLLRYARGLGID